MSKGESETKRNGGVWLWQRERKTRVKMEGGRKVLPTDRDGGGRKKDEGDEEGETKGRRPRQVERRRKFISKEMWDDAPE
ncbi:hypothetical protein RF55_10990 [Lasius niger]|uniref:Uncharacterized protein n=1 Tax=Lasius niger TaxID=67767 RepID=A0A0J7KGL7_LASNI|nr:hypothetical protein RF55_10990 [Lasius niger]